MVIADGDWAVARRAEELGFSHAWFYDTQLISPDLFVTMALAAEHTERIVLGTGVMVPSNRIAPVAANGLATLNRLAPGRIVLGLGTGFTARNTMGLGPMRLGETIDYAEAVRALLREETVELELEGGARKVRFLNPDRGLINTVDEVPLHFSAFGPRGMAFTAEHADGWMTFGLGGLEGMLTAVEAIDEACAGVDRDPDSLYRTAFTMGSVLADGEAADSERARAQAGPQATVFLHAGVEGSLPGLPAAVQQLVDDYRALHASFEPPDARYLQMHRDHLLWVRPEEERFLTSELIGMTSLTASADELAGRMSALAEAGLDQLAVQLAPGHADALEDWARVAREAGALG